VLGLVAAVVLVGVLGTAALIVMLRPRANPEATERPPVTTRPVAEAEGSGLGTTAPAPPETTLPAAPTTTTAAAGPRPVATPSPRRSTTTAPVQVAESTPPPPVAPAPTLPAVAEPTHAAAAPAFPGAGKVDLGEKFYEKTLTYEVGSPIAFDGHVGPLKAATVQFSVGDKKGRFGKVDELKTEIRAVVPVLDCPKGAGEWDFKLVVELLDESGRRLDKFDGGGSCENEIKTVAATRAIMKALVPAIRGVRVRLEAAKD
jgi:hypothetical protein